MPTSAQFPATVSLSTLNGKNGFKLTGENIGDKSGNSVSSAGDVNGDGIADFVIGAYAANSGAGASYLVFGHPGIWTSPISLSSLTGSNGVKFTGENANDQCGISVSGAGDVNGDGIADFVIGAYAANSGAGASYLIFGHNGTWTSPIALSGLTGTNGVKFIGENALDYTSSVGSAGDVNGDGIADFIIGGSNANSGAGYSYLIFGHNGIWTSPIALSSLTGTNGVKFTGSSHDGSGVSVRTTGDVNGDGIADIIIGAYAAGSFNGAGYLIFGHTGPWSSPIALSSLTGSNGVKFTGENSNDNGGWSVSLAGDVNGDAIADFIVGAVGANSKTGASYMVFGHNGTWTSPIAMSSLTGSNGVKFTGENPNDNSGWSVSLAGDVNGDAIADIIVGADGANSKTGASYMVFGHTGSWSSPIALSSLTGVNGVKFTGENANDFSAYSVGSAGDVNGDGIADIIIGAYGPNSNTGASYVIFGDNPSLIRNQLIISEGSFLTLNNTYLNALTGNTKPLQTQFNLTNIQHGHFELLSQPGQSISNFTQQMVNANQIRFVHDSSCFAPSYQVSVFDGGLAYPSVSQNAAITFLPIMPYITANYLILNSGQAVVLGPNNLNATDPGDIFPNLRYTINSLTHGQFSTIDSPLVPITQFTQQQINDGLIQFVSDTSGIRPTYSVAVQDSCGLTSNFYAYTANFYALPFVGVNQLTINEGQTVLLTSVILSSSSPNGVGPSGLTLTVSNLQRGHFELVSQPGQVVNHFTQLQVNNLQVRFVHDRSCGAPAYQVSVFDGGPAAASSPTSASVMFTPINPVITKNTLSAIPGQSVILGTSNLNATDPGDNFPNLRYVISSLQHGQFSTVSNPTVSISQFTQQQVNDGIIQFVADSSGVAPSYVLSVQDSCGLTSNASAANIFFHQLPRLGNNQLAINQGQTLILTSDNLNATDMNDATKSPSLQFSVSNVQHGHFETLSNPGSVISSFYQQNVSTGVIEFIHDGSVQAPSFSTSVSDGLVSTSPSAAMVTFNPNVSLIGSAAPDNTVRNSIIGGTISGGVSLFFLLLKIFLEKKANEYINREALNDEFRKKVVIPLAREVSSQIKISKFLSYVSEDTTRAYVRAIIEVITQLQRQGIDVQAQMAGDPDRTRLMSEIVRQTRKILLGEASCCSSFSAFFCPEVTPQQIEDKAKNIAIAVKDKIRGSISEPQPKPIATASIELTEAKSRAGSAHGIGQSSMKGSGSAALQGSSSPVPVPITPLRTVVQERTNAAAKDVSDRYRLDSGVRSAPVAAGPAAL